MRKYGYLVVEGPHDVAFAYRLLEPFKLKQIQYKHIVDEAFHRLILTSYPDKDGDIQKRMPTPLFLQNETHAIAICSAVGDSQLINTIMGNEVNLDISVESIGILLDSDTQMSAQQRYTKVKADLAEASASKFVLPAVAGTITQGKPNLGAFVLPDNQTAGTLEDLLLESAEQKYPCLLKMAKNYVADAKYNAGLKKSELKELKNAGENKAIIGAMATIMRPAKSIQVSIQDNDWLRGTALEIERIKSVQNFLKILFDL
ncbi:hypothetical protein BCS42_07720 [Crenothrix sp. D3]|nr:hypothetical protein BCS42_07720 [Crenothrix sp. D3]